MLSVAVVIPAFNAAETLGKQLDALMDQTLKPSEIIVADNGSTDSTAAVIASYARQSVRFVDASQRRGASAARNIGVRSTSSEVVLLCDADDIVASTWVETMTYALQRNDSVGGVLLPFSDRAKQCQQEPIVPRTRFGYLEAPATANAGFRRSVFDAVGGFSEDYPGASAEDVDFFWRAQQLGFSYEFVGDSAVEYRLRATALAKLRQEFLYGRADALLYKRHRAEGMPRSLAKVPYRYVHFLITCPRLLASTCSRQTWLGHLGKNLGRIWGSYENRILFL